MMRSRCRKVLLAIGQTKISSFRPNLEPLECRIAPATNIALNVARTGFPTPLQSDRGWGGGSFPWEIVDGKRSYNDFAHGLAFTGGRSNWGGEPGGPRQATIDFGSVQTFDNVVIWWHGPDHAPASPTLESWNGSTWSAISTNRVFGRLHEDGTNSGSSDSDEYSFTAVAASKVRISFNNLGASMLDSSIEHGWIYEFEVFAPENTAPQIQAGPDIALTEGEIFTGSGSFTDADPGSPWSATVDYGDGTGVAPLVLKKNKSFDLSHHYPEDGNYTVTVTVTDALGAVGNDTLLVRVANAPATITSLSSSSPDAGGSREGDLILVTASFIDPGILDTHTATINWGDGTLAQPAEVSETDGFGFLISEHAYELGGTYTITLTVSDNDNASATGLTQSVIVGARVHDNVLEIVGTSAADYVLVAPGLPNQIAVTSNFLGRRVYPTAGIQRIQMALGDGNDVAVVNTAIRLSTLIRGDAGNDSITGGSGLNILLGGLGDDILTGGNSRDLLIGGAGRDRLLGLGDDDLLVAGFTDHDDTDAALIALMNEWSRNATFAQRLARITSGGGLNGSAVLSATTVHDDLVSDDLSGGSGTDAYFLNRSGTSTADRVLDFWPYEAVIDTPQP